MQEVVVNEVAKLREVSLCISEDPQIRENPMVKDIIGNDSTRKETGKRTHQCGGQVVPTW